MTCGTMRTQGAASVFLYLICVLLQFVEFSLEQCPNRCEVQIDNSRSMQRGENVILCLDDANYSLRGIALLEDGCDSLEGEYVRSTENDTYNCAALNRTTDGFFHDGNGGRTCKQLMVIECVKRVPVLKSNMKADGDSEDGNGGESEEADRRSAGDGDDDSWTMGLLLRGPAPSQELCNAFINVSMRELDDPEEDNDDVCDDITAENFNFCFSLCINSTMDTVEICSELADSLLDDDLRGSVGDDDIDAAFDILNALSSLTGSVSGLNATVGVIGSLAGTFTANSSLISPFRGQALAAIIDDTISEERSEVWRSLQQGTERFQSSNLLNSLETIQSALAESVTNQREDFHFLGNNIQMLAVERIGEEDVQSGAYNFPAQTSIKDLSRLEIPRDVLCRSELKKSNRTGCSAVVSAAIVQNLPTYLDQTSFAESSNQKTNSLLMSIRIQNMDEKEEYNNDNVLQRTPVVIYFTGLKQNVTPGETDCVFWNFTERRWSSNGLTTAVDTNSNMIRCASTHLTSFAVLVDVNGLEGDSAQVYALKLVTYAGCVVSLVCLALSLVILISCGKHLKKGVLLYVHVNFIIALALALLVFVTGIETAVRIREVCAAVAALLHYLFLCVFCWMLAEGIMLYLLVVRVFGTITKRWYYLLILGWGLPVPIVAVSAGIRFEDYGRGPVCWLPTKSGVVYSFIGPMIAIILANSIILVLTLRSLLRGKKFRQNSNTCRATKLALVWSSLKSTIILLPLLGITWIIGVLAINENTTVFAWLFTVLNSLQGFFVFAFHVLRNDKVKSSVKQFFRHSFRCCVCKETQRRGSTITLTKSNSTTLATTNTNCPDSERASDHPVIGRTLSETSQDSSLDYNFTMQQ